MAREQRKLAAILAADVVGYSRLIGLDESGTMARLGGTVRTYAILRNQRLSLRAAADAPHNFGHAEWLRYQRLTNKI